MSFLVENAKTDYKVQHMFTGLARLNIAVYNAMESDDVKAAIGGGNSVKVSRMISVDDAATPSHEERRTKIDRQSAEASSVPKRSLSTSGTFVELEGSTRSTAEVTTNKSQCLSGDGRADLHHGPTLKSRYETGSSPGHQLNRFWAA